MDEKEIQDILENLINEGESEFTNEYVSVTNFEDQNLLTKEKGLILSIGNDEFQITIVRSK